MSRFNAAKMSGAADKAFQTVYNRLIDLLDIAYIAEAIINGKNIKVSVSPQTPFELSIDGIKEIYINTDGVLVPNRYDINEDGIVDATDVTLISDYLLTGEGYLPRMDTNGSGAVTLTDYIEVKKHCFFSMFAPQGASGSGVSVSEDDGSITITDASTDADGLLTSEDWNTFNGKQDHSTELDALSALEDTAGFVKKTGDAAYEIDTNTYTTHPEAIAYAIALG